MLKAHSDCCVKNRPRRTGAEGLSPVLRLLQTSPRLDLGMVWSRLVAVETERRGSLRFSVGGGLEDCLGCTEVIAGGMDRSAKSGKRLIRK